MHRQKIIFRRLPQNIAVRAGSVRSTPDRQVAEVSAEERHQKAVQRDNQQIRDALQSIQFELQEFESRRQQSIAELQQIAVELAVMAAGHVVGQQLEQGTFNIEKLVSSAVEMLPLQEPATIRLNPQDLQLLQSRMKSEATAWDQTVVQLVADASMSRGGLRLDTNSGRILLSDVASRLSEIRLHWMEHIDDSQTERREISDDAQRMRRFPDRRETA